MRPLALLAAGMMMASCGFTTYRAPVIVEGDKPSVKCKPGRGGVAFDGILGLVLAGSAVGIATDPESKQNDTERAVSATLVGIGGAFMLSSAALAWSRGNDCREMLERYPLYVPPLPTHAWDGVVVTSDRRDVKGCDLINTFEARTGSTKDSIEKLKAIVFGAGGNAALLTGESRDRRTQTAEAYACPPPGSPAPVAAGCAKDTDCKGDRICVDGACVSPPPTGVSP